MQKQEVFDKKMVVKKILSCSGCAKIVSNPQTLHCYHTFCSNCIKLLQRKTDDDGKSGLVCSNCKCFSPDLKVQDNILVNEFLEMFQISERGETGVCKQCTKRKYTYKCVECKMSLCEDCQELHARVPLLKNHRVIPLKTDRITLIIDRVIFCSVHDDEPVKLNCIDCSLPLCIKCKVTEHEDHRTETVEKALARISPILENNCSLIEVKMKDLNQMHSDLLQKITDTKHVFSECRQEADKNLKQLMDSASGQHKTLTESLFMKEEEAINKLEIAKEKIDHKLKEHRKILEWVNITSRYVRGTSLLSEYETGLQTRVLDLSSRKFKLSAVVDYPKLEDNVQQKEMEDMIGSLKYDKVVAISSNVSSNGKHTSVPLLEVFDKPLKVLHTIQLPEICNRIAIVNSEIWVPLSNQKCIQIYDMSGELQRSYTVPIQPRSVGQLSEAEMVLAGNPGLLLLDKAGKVMQEISTKHNFTDLDVIDGVITALNSSLGHYQEYTKTSGEWKLSKDYGLFREIPTDSSLINLGKQFLTTANHTIQKYNKSGQILGDIGVHGTPGSAKTNAGSLCTPFLCCVDDYGSMLVADCSNGRIQLSTENDWKVVCTTGDIPNLSYPCDCKVDDEMHVWITNGNNLLLCLG